MAVIRFGIIGVGGMGMAHVKNVVAMKGARVSAVCDVVEARAKTAAETAAGSKMFVDYRELVDSGLADAVIVATPHYWHSPIAICAMKKGLHVISEKPLGVTLTAVDKMIATAKRTGVKFAVMLQWRTGGLWQTAKRVIRSGRLGELRRVHYVFPDYRPQAYYEQDAWRGTWAGEGGGVLVNQAPHFTDMLWYLAGEPRTVIARTRTRLHQIEVEDEAEAMLEYPNGATGHYYTCTCEFPGRHYVRFAGDRAVLDIEGGKLRLGKLKTPLGKFDRTNREPWGNPGADWVEVPVKERKRQGHIGIVQNFVDAINRGTKLIAPGEEGIHQVEMTCAMILSSKKSKPVTLPVDRKEYDRLMATLARESTGKKGAVKGVHRTKVVTHFT